MAVGKTRDRSELARRGLSYEEVRSRVEAGADLLRHVVFKGSIAVDGISLTVAEVTAESFAVWIIPHTYEVTALRERRTGDRVNLETDLLAKYVEKIGAK